MDAQLMWDARVVANTTIGIKPGESVLVATDAARRREADALGLAADEAGASVAIMDVSQHVNEVLVGQSFWTEPPAAVLAAVQASNVSVFVVDETYGQRLSHQVEHLVTTGPECTVYKLDLGMGTWGLTPRDIELADSLGERLVSAIDGQNRVRITGPAGTDVELSIRGRDCLPVVSVPTRGLHYGIPIPIWGEYNWAPIEDSANGVIVIDGMSEASGRCKAVGAPVRWTVGNGCVTKVEGGLDADDFAQQFAKDDGAAVIGELGVGVNPKGRPGTENEKCLLGTVHFGMGDNSIYPGGMNRSAVHIDGVVRGVTVDVDGRRVIDQGRLII